jgi:hypothetical protein
MNLDENTKIFTPIRKCVVKSLAEFIEKDVFLIKMDLNERSITHKLAEHLQRNFPCFDVDCEYNKDTVEGCVKKIISDIPKDTIEWEDTKSKTVYPDIIIHKRGKCECNILVIEAKKARNTPHDFDKMKLIAYTKGKLNYQFGLFLVFDMKKKQCKLTWFKDGEPNPKEPEIIPITCL